MFASMAAFYRKLLSSATGPRYQPSGTAGLDFVPAALPPNARWYMPWRFARWRGTNPDPPAPIPAAPGAAGE
jgi:hypothetical protein